MKNILKGTRCYLVGHMEYSDGQGWRDRIEEEVGNKMGVTCFNPYKKPFVNQRPEDISTRKWLAENMQAGNLQIVHEHMKQVRADDLRLCDISDFFICHIIPKVASWGSAEEISTANRMKKPIFIAVEGGVQQTPLWLLGKLKPHYFYNNIEEIIDMLGKINRGEKEIDSDRWRLLREEFR